jgi:hypothetical protein
VKADDAARRKQRLEELHNLRDAGGDWPSHQKMEDKHERTLGVWLHGQRIDYRAGRLDLVQRNRLTCESQR